MSCNKYIPDNKHKPDSGCHEICDGITDEFDAIRFYTKLIRLYPEDKKTFDEIKKDERDHLGKLLKLNKKYDCSCFLM